MSPIQGWHLRERVLRDPQLSALKRCCSTPSWPPSSPLGDLYSAADLGKCYPISALEWSPKLQTTVGGIWGGRGTEPHAELPTGPWLASRTGRGPHLQLSFLGLSTLRVWLDLHLGQSVLVNMPLPQWGFVLPRRGEEGRGDTILSITVTQTFQGLMGGGSFLWQSGSPRPEEGEGWRLRNLGLLRPRAGY